MESPGHNEIKFLFMYTIPWSKHMAILMGRGVAFDKWISDLHRLVYFNMVVSDGLLFIMNQANDLVHWLGNIFISTDLEVNSNFMIASFLTLNEHQGPLFIYCQTLQCQS